MNKYCVMDPITLKPVTYINHMLVKQQGVSDAELDLIKESHVLLNRIYEDMAVTNDPTILKAHAARCTELEFIQQKLWHFTQDASYHNWYKVPNCACPKIDNAERRGTNYQVINSACIIHGESTK